MDLSILILNYKTPGLLKNCLRGILRYQLAVKYEIIVIDNQSGDGSVEMMRSQFSDIKLIVSPANVGHAAGNNLGIKAAQGRYVLLLNPDVVIMDNSIEKMVRFMDEHAKVAAASCQLANPDGSIQMNCRRFPDVLTPIYSRTWLGQLPAGQKSMAHYLMTDFDHQQSMPVDWIFAATLIVRKSAIEQVGPLDERFFLYFADVDWCRQFWQNGWQVYYQADAKIVHYHNRESAENSGFFSLLNQKTRIHIRDWIKYLKKYGANRERIA